DAIELHLCEVSRGVGSESWEGACFGDEHTFEGFKNGWKRIVDGEPIDVLRAVDFQLDENSVADSKRFKRMLSIAGVEAAIRSCDTDAVVACECGFWGCWNAALHGCLDPDG